MWSAGTTYGTPPARLSMHRTRHHLTHFMTVLLAAGSTQRHQIYRTLLKVIVHKAVPARPGRSEPRVRKRRPLVLPLNETTQTSIYCSIANCLNYKRCSLS